MSLANLAVTQIARQSTECALLPCSYHSPVPVAFESNSQQELSFVGARILKGTKLQCELRSLPISFGHLVVYIIIKFGYGITS